ncbi:prepilin peptidase [Pontibacillus litoralis]|uniref:Prepilin peptidase n=1 Tax=Pontibacillus litoralis JSM 072002 TaxID=1385512 RepID=A0A0A5GAJ8_9BACI|nr:A24 family peptidase [Pontibacillus litoralis]KGX89019.1 prepilin peptidase [Pontibacillus litoralis JSM 072002]
MLFFGVYVFIIGLIFGSFYNVVGLRAPKSEGFFTSRSKCPQCAHMLTWVELVPVFSYAIQKGRCRMCQEKIAWMYPVVEISTALLFVCSYVVFDYSVELIVSICFMSLLMIVFVTDITYMIIPDKVLVYFLPLFIILRAIEPLTPWYDSVVGAVVGVGIIAVIIFVSRGGMGAGDMKLFGVIGVVLGVKKTVLAFLLSTLSGAVISGVLLAFGIIQRNKPIPFGPFIIFGSIVAYFIGDSLIDWYVTTFFR